jgi:hypothetical protein
MQKGKTDDDAIRYKTPSVDENKNFNYGFEFLSNRERVTDMVIEV